MNLAVQVAVESNGGVGYRDLQNQSRTAAGTILMRNLCKQGKIFEAKLLTNKERDKRTKIQTDKQKYIDNQTTIACLKDLRQINVMP